MAAIKPITAAIQGAKGEANKGAIIARIRGIIPTAAGCTTVVPRVNALAATAADAALAADAAAALAAIPIPTPPAYKAPVPITSIALRPEPPSLYFALVSRTASSHFQSPPPQRLLTSNCTPLAGKALVIVLPSFSTDLVALLNASVVLFMFNLTSVSWLLTSAVVLFIDSRKGSLKSPLENIIIA